jgi:molybdopterin-binding protein
MRIVDALHDFNPSRKALAQAARAMAVRRSDDRSRRTEIGRRESRCDAKDTLLHRFLVASNVEHRVLRNQLVGRIVDVGVSGLAGQVPVSIGGQLITSLLTSSAIREMKLKKGQTAAALVKATEAMIIRV